MKPLFSLSRSLLKLLAPLCCAAAAVSRAGERSLSAFCPLATSGNCLWRDEAGNDRRGLVMGGRGEAGAEVGSVPAAVSAFKRHPRLSATRDAREQEE